MNSGNHQRDFMRQAIEEMRASRAEHTHKHDPIVGAVIVDSQGKLMGKTHRGSHRIGNHAEFTLIDRLLSDQDLEGSTIYVTLEPCTVRSPDKKPCADRIISARIQKVVIGMLDPDPRIQGNGVTKLQESNIEVQFFDHELVRQIRKENKAYIDQFSDASVDDHLTAVFEVPLIYETETLETARFNDLSDDLIKEYLNRKEITFESGSSELFEYFRRNDFVAQHQGSEQVIPTKAGLLLFGTNPGDFLPQSVIKAEVHSGARVTTEDISKPLLWQPKTLWHFLSQYLRTYTEIRGFTRVAVPIIPQESIREAIVNAIVHRDYNNNAHIIVQAYDDHMIIKSPGLPPQPTTLQTIRNLDAHPYSRNPRIAQTFYHMGLMEERGWGLRKMHDLLVKQGFPPPDFNFVNGFFEVTLHFPSPREDYVRISDDLLQSLTDRQKAIVRIIQEEGGTTSASCTKLFKVSKQAIVTDFQELIGHGIIEKRGRGRYTSYVLFGT